MSGSTGDDEVEGIECLFWNSSSQTIQSMHRLRALPISAASTNPTVVYVTKFWRCVKKNFGGSRSGPSEIHFSHLQNFGADFANWRSPDATTSEISESPDARNPKLAISEISELKSNFGEVRTWSAEKFPKFSKNFSELRT